MRLQRSKLLLALLTVTCCCVTSGKQKAEVHQSELRDGKADSFFTSSSYSLSATICEPLSYEGCKLLWYSLISVFGQFRNVPFKNLAYLICLVFN